MGHSSHLRQAQQFIALHDQVQTVFRPVVTPFPLPHTVTPDQMLMQSGITSHASLLLFDKHSIDFTLTYLNNLTVSFFLLLGCTNTGAPAEDRARCQARPSGIAVEEHAADHLSASVKSVNRRGVLT